MGSVTMTVVCPQCGNPDAYNEFKTSCEEFTFCPRCGYYWELKFLRDRKEGDGKRYKLTKAGQFIPRERTLSGQGAIHIGNKHQGGSVSYSFKKPVTVDEAQAMLAEETKNPDTYVLLLTIEGADGKLVVIHEAPKVALIEWGIDHHGEGCNCGLCAANGHSYGVAICKLDNLTDPVEVIYAPDFGVAWSNASQACREKGWAPTYAEREGGIEGDDSDLWAEVPKAIVDTEIPF